MRGAYTETVRLAAKDCSALSELTASAALRLMQDVAGHGSDSAGVTRELLLSHQMVFMTAAHAVRFLRPLRAGETVCLVTNPAKATGAHLLRQTLFLDETGALLAEGQSDWTLVDTVTGFPHRAKDLPLPYELLEHWEPFCDPSRLRLTMPETPCGTYCVTAADIDENRHMNNTVYAQVLTDCFADLPQRSVASFAIRYQHQAYEGDLLELRRELSPDGDHRAGALLGGVPCFTGQLRFF